MLKTLSKNQKIGVAISVLVGVILMCALLMRGCQAGTTKSAAPAPVKKNGIISPASDGTKSSVGSLVQIQSTHTDPKITHVELWVKSETEAEKFIGSAAPQNGTVSQQWTPQAPGLYTLKVRAFNATNEAQADLVRQVQIVESSAVASEQKAGATNNSEAGNLAPPVATASAMDTTEVLTAARAEVEIAVVHTEALPEPTAIPRYPPAPPAPGVPYGPTQANLNNFGPPVCDAAQYMGAYSSDTSRRIIINEPDDVAVKVVAGTVVHRAWRLTNMGTCTWGPGYELAFYGGRTMGSGGVAFESYFPNTPPRRNTIIDKERLIAPEGKPNETAVLEVLLTVPTTPGVHQSFWRMRNPHGVFFGPVVGVTMEVVRECAFGIYGAPVINKFDILGVGNVYKPVDPARVQAEFGMPVTLQWDIINATNFDIVFESPTSEVESTSTTDSSSRATFMPKNLGEHTVTLYADNGSCTVSQQVKIEVVPPTDQQFTLDILLPGLSTTNVRASGVHIASDASLAANQIKAVWNHYDKKANEFTLIAEPYHRVYTDTCLIKRFKFICWPSWTDWSLTPPSPTLHAVSIPMGKVAQGAATVSNTESTLCPSKPFDPLKENHGVRYSMRAKANGAPATPEYSNAVDILQCKQGGSSANPESEIQGVRTTTFNPGN